MRSWCRRDAGQLAVETGKSRPLPRVSAIVPCRNEVYYIAQCIESMLASSYPAELLEILVVDGMSRDGTREIVKRYGETWARVRMLDNQQGTIPAAMNIGIREARGEIILKTDAHSAYESDYVTKCVRSLLDYGADNVGGLCRHLPREDTALGRAIVKALSHPFGVGNSRFRVGCQEVQSADTAYGGCFRREVFERIGPYDERIKYSEDISYNARIRRAGGVVLLDPRISIDYFVRSDLRSFIAHNWRNGVWAVLPCVFMNMPMRVRHVIPLICAAGALAMIVGWLIWGWMWEALALSSVAYVLACAAATVDVGRRWGEWRNIWLMPLVFSALHFSYGMGSIWGVLRAAAKSTRDLAGRALVGARRWAG